MSISVIGIISGMVIGSAIGTLVSVLIMKAFLNKVGRTIIENLDRKFRQEVKE
jgi:hypothetical protein